MRAGIQNLKGVIHVYDFLFYLHPLIILSLFLIFLYVHYLTSLKDNLKFYIACTVLVFQLGFLYSFIHLYV